MLSLMVLALLAQDPFVPCETPAKTRKVLENLAQVRDHAIPYDTRMAPLRILAENNPEDFFIQRFYQDAFRRSFYLAGEYDRALSLYRKSPNNALSRYFEARLLLKVEPERSQKTFQELMATKPDFVWPHLDLAELTAMPGRRDSSELETHLKAFLRVCPDSPEAYDHFGLVQDTELLRQGAQSLRKSLERRNMPLDLTHWPRLWALESRAKIDHKEIQDRIRKDLKGIDSRRSRLQPELLVVYRQGSELLKDPSILEAFEATVSRSAPESGLMLAVLQNRWYRENPSPPRDASFEVHRAHREKEDRVKAEWRQRWPADCRLIQDEWLRFNATAMRNDRLSPEEVLPVVDRWLRCRTEFPDLGVSWPPLETGMAEIYVKCRARLDQVPKLLDAGLRAIEDQEKYRLNQNLIPLELRGRAVDNKAATYERTQQIRIDYFLAVGRSAEARTLIEQEIARVEANTPGSASTQEQMRFRVQHNQWRQRLGAVAEKENRVEEALTLYQSSLAGLPKQALTNPNNPTLAEIKRFYLAHGGSEEKWLEWATVGKTDLPLPTRPPIQFLQPLPTFSAKDLFGRTWELRDLKGKGTLVNFWATWCGPCRAEHPELQKLHERLKGNQDLQIITLSVDENPASVALYLKEKGYTFPVIHAPLLGDRLFPYVGLPTNFLVNSNGWRTSLYPFVGGEQSLRRVLSDLEAGAAK